VLLCDPGDRQRTAASNLRESIGYAGGGYSFVVLGP